MLSRHCVLARACWVLACACWVSACALAPCSDRAAAAAPARPVAPDEPLTFERHIRPILKTYCFHCHGEGKIEGGLDVRLRRLLVAGGDSGTALVPGVPQESYLLDRLRSGEMPPPEIAIRPQAAQLDLIERWIANGASTARPEPDDVGALPLITDEERGHWAFRPLARPAIPAPREAASIRSPIDALVVARLADAGLSLSPEADRATLIRRATLDLIGLPPTPEEVAEFVADRRPDAYERLIDRLLASPHYGERWGQHWLDVAGYADSEGYNDDDVPRSDAWRYRDYVIRSFNADKPLDEFIVEQLAGDELVGPPYEDLSPRDAELLIATGFLRMAPDGTAARGGNDEVARNAVLTETVKIVSSTLLGMTVGCAECHDHRYDPIPQTDFYRLRAVFEPALDWKKWRTPSQRQISLLSPADEQRWWQLENEAKAVETAFTAKLVEYRDWVFAREVELLPAELRDAGSSAGLAYQRDPKQLRPEQQQLLDNFPGLRVSASAGALNLFLQKYGRGDELAADIAAMTKEADAIRARKPRRDMVRALTELPGQVPVTYLFERGDLQQPGAAVGPGDLTVTAPQGHATDLPLDDPDLPTTGRRLALARHWTRGDHPLVTRVLANRVWLHHFGRGLVATPGDFGTQGAPPTHPELLDYLATQLVACGWSLKSLHGEIMRSSVYRQTSTRRGEAAALDPENELLWRMPVRRLEAEALRDSILAVTGMLDRKQFGPSVPVVLDETSQAVVGTASGDEQDVGQYRRSIYVEHRRSTPAYVLSAFDAPQMEPNCELRSPSTVAPQALLLMNSRFVVEQAERFADRVVREAGTASTAQVRHAWRLAYGVEPSQRDMRELLRYLAAQRRELAAHRDVAATPTVGDAPTPMADQDEAALASLCQVLLASSRLMYVD